MSQDSERRQTLVGKGVFNLSAVELIELERLGGESGVTSDLATALADALVEMGGYLALCLDQISDYSDNEWVMNGRREKTIAEMRSFIAPVGG